MCSIDGITVERRKGHYPHSFPKNRTIWGYGTEAKEEWVTFDEFPDLKPVKLNKPRGRPRELLLPAKVRGAREDGASIKELEKRFKLDSRSVRNFLKEPSAKKK